MSTKIKKIKGLIITLIIVAFIVLVVKGLHLLTKPVYTTDVLGQRDYDSHIKNSAVEINRDNFGTVQFVNGQYEFKFSGIKDLDIIGYLSIRKVVFGGLNGDIYKPDAAEIGRAHV